MSMHDICFRPDFSGPAYTIEARCSRCQRYVTVTFSQIVTDFVSHIVDAKIRAAEILNDTPCDGDSRAA